MSQTRTIFGFIRLKHVDNIIGLAFSTEAALEFSSYSKHGTIWFHRAPHVRNSRARLEKVIGEGLAVTSAVLQMLVCN